MAVPVLGLTLSLALVNWLAVEKKWRQLEFLAKPGVMLALLAWLVLSTGVRGSLIWFALAILFSLAGDVFLMLPREQFIAGLVSFLLAHLAYIVGLNTGLPPTTPAGLVMLVLIAGLAVSIYRRLAAGLKRSGQTKLAAPVLVYTLVISLMVLSALFTLLRPEWDLTAALLVSTGAVLFFLSDSLLAWNKFVAPVPHGRLFTMMTYHLGQVALIGGAIMQFSS